MCGGGGEEGGGWGCGGGGECGCGCVSGGDNDVRPGRKTKYLELFGLAYRTTKERGPEKQTQTIPFFMK